MKKNSSPIINKTMSRQDLLSEKVVPSINELNTLIRRLYARGLNMSSWVGTLPGPQSSEEMGRVRRFIKWMRNRGQITPDTEGESAALERGMAQRLNYVSLPGAEDDLRIPWFLYWEIIWVMRVIQPHLHEGMRLLDAGGTSSLFTCYLASKGFDVYSVDLNQRLWENGKRLVQEMGWKMHSYTMDMRRLDFPNHSFDHAFSICVFEHLDYDVKQAALAEVARCLKPGGIFSITFDYRNPAPGVVGYGKDPRPRNALKTVANIQRNFLSTGLFELLGNQKFHDNGESYLLHPRFDSTPYTFGAIFLRTKKA